MFTSNVATPFRKNQRRHRRNRLAVARERRPTRIVVPEIVERDPIVAWSDAETRHSDVDLEFATWEDAEWR